MLALFRGIPFVWLTQGFQYIITEVFPALGISKAKTDRKVIPNKEKSTYKKRQEERIKQARGTKRCADDKENMVARL